SRALSASAETELGVLDADAIERGVTEAWPTAANPDELHDALLWMGVMTEDEFAQYDRTLGEALTQAKRAARLRHGRQIFWVTAERLPMLRAIYSEASIDPHLTPPDSTLKEQ